MAHGNGEPDEPGGDYGYDYYSDRVYEWKQFLEGIRRGIIGPFTVEDKEAGPNVTREYKDGNQKMAWLRITGGNVNSNVPAHANNRTFFVHPSMVAETEHIYIPTSKDLDNWEGGDECLAGCDTLAEIAAREPTPV